jgi:hypothetical protein
MTTGVSTVSQNVLPLAEQVKRDQPQTQPEAPPSQPQDTVSTGDEQQHPKNDITIKQAVSALAGAAVGGVIEGVGNTASSIYNLPKGVFHAAKTIWKTDLIGPNLKIAATILLPVATVATPIIVALGSIGYGFYHGAAEAGEHSEKEGFAKGMKEAVTQTAKDVKYFHKDLASKAVNELANLEVPHLEPGQKPYDIKIIEAGKGLVGAAAGAVIDGVGVGGLALAKTPKGTFRLYQAIFNSDQGPVLKTTESLLAPVAVCLASPLATVGGTLYGTYKGFGDAYQKGLGESINNRLHDVKEFNDATKKALENPWK